MDTSPAPGPATRTPCRMDFRLPPAPPTVFLLEEQRRPAALQLPLGHDGDAVPQQVGLVHEVGVVSRMVRSLLCCCRRSQMALLEMASRLRWARQHISTWRAEGRPREDGRARPGGCRSCRRPRAYLGARDEAMPMEACAASAPQKPAPGVPLLLQPEHVQHAFDLLRALLTGQAFQLKRQGWRIRPGLPMGPGAYSKHLLVEQ